MLDHVDDRLVPALIEDMGKKKAFAARLEAWMQSQSCIVSEQTRDANAERAVRFSSYMLLNRMWFYNALRWKYPEFGDPTALGLGTQAPTRAREARACPSGLGRSRF
jgi:hypothetical protein